MPPNTTNLLPDDKAGSFRRVYFFRLVTFATYLGMFVIATHAVLLFPTHILLSSHVATRTLAAEQLRGDAASSDEAVFETRLAELLKSASRVEALGQARSAGQVLGEILALPHARVSLTALSYQAVGGAKKAPTITLTGTAATRDALRAYQVALQGSPFVLATDLPVSVYAKEVDLPFLITLTLKSK